AMPTTHVDQFLDAGEVVDTGDGRGHELCNRDHRFVEERGCPHPLRTPRLLEIDAREFGPGFAGADGISEPVPRPPQELPLEENVWLQRTLGVAREEAADRRQGKRVFRRLRAEAERYQSAEQAAQGRLVRVHSLGEVG